MKPAIVVIQKLSHNPSLRPEINHRRVALVNTAMRGRLACVQLDNSVAALISFAVDPILLHDNRHAIRSRTRPSNAGSMRRHHAFAPTSGFSGTKILGIA